MSAYQLPQLAADRPFLTDGGLETDLIFHHGAELPAFASFVLLDTDEGRNLLRTYFHAYLDLARTHGTGLVLETPTWRANPAWGDALGYGPPNLERINRESVAFVAALRDEAEDMEAPIVLSGCIGPRGDGYVPGERLSPTEAASYHHAQVATFADTEADCVTAMTLSYADEAIGVAQAAAEIGIPSVISFTVETDGRLPSGKALGDAIQAVDDATSGAPAYYMVNCAHPTHFLDVLDGAWTGRVRGIRANASTCSHAELDEAEVLDEGDPLTLAAGYVQLADKLPRLAVVGGCCGTDVRHIASIAEALLPVAAA